MQRWPAALSVLLALLLALPVKAEYCDMTGETGQTVWLWIPESQYMQVDETTYMLNGKSYPIDRRGRVFVENGLPEVNQTVTLQSNIASTSLPECLPRHDCPSHETARHKVIKQQSIYKILGDNAVINQEGYYCTYAGGNRGCWDLNAGAKVKILGLTKFERILFALVQVKDC